MTDTTKGELVNHIKEWIKIDTEINKLTNELKERKEKKKKMSGQLMDIMKQNNLDCFDINGGAILYKKNVSKKPINAKMLTLLLNQYYPTASEKAEELTKYIMDNREEQVKETILRKINNKK
jgi:hypothetical protein